MKITNAELEVVRFAAEDVLATSLFIINDGNPYTGYSMMSGVMTPTEEPGTWIVTQTNGKWEIDEATVENEKNGAYGIEEWTVVYDAYKTDPEGPYYTHGASYYELYGNNGQ